MFRYSSRLLLSVAGAVLLCSSAPAKLQRKVPVVVCPRVSTAPVVDGKITAEEYKDAGRLSRFMLLGSEGMPELQTHGYVLHTSDSLYVAANMQDDRPDQLVANVTERDGQVYNDDCLELYIDTEGNREQYAHLIVNSIGTQYDALNKDRYENYQWKAAVSVLEDGWTAEIKLPFSQGIAPEAGETWNMAVCRNAARADELSTWAAHKRGFHEPEVFGTLRFVRPLLTAVIDDPGQRWWGDNMALINVQNLSTSVANCKIYVVTMGQTPQSHYSSHVKAKVKGGATKQLYVPYKVRRCGPAWLTFSLVDEQGTVAWRSAALPIDLPPVSKPLDDVLHQISEAWKLWAQLGPAGRQDTTKSSIEVLQKDWQHLDQLAAKNGQLTAGELEALSSYIAELQKRADNLLQLLRARAARAGAETGRSR